MLSSNNIQPQGTHVAHRLTCAREEHCKSYENVQCEEPLVVGFMRKANHNITNQNLLSPHMKLRHSALSKLPPPPPPPVKWISPIGKARGKVFAM